MPISDSKRRLAFSVLNRNFGSPSNQQKGFASIDAAAHSAATLVAAQAKVSFSTANTLVREWYAQAGHVSETRQMMTSPRLDNFTRQYIETALWSTNDESDDRGGEPLDANYGIDDIDPATMAQMIADCADFQERYGELISQAEIDDGQAGHWFWLTRNGHGANFLDDDYKKSPEVSAALKGLYKAAKEYGEVNLMVDDGVISDGIHWTPPGASEARRPMAHAARRGHRVADFTTLPEIIAHAQAEGATHVVVSRSGATVYFPIRSGGRYEEAILWHEHGYWHSPAPTHTKIVERLPKGAEPIGEYLAGGQVAAERRGHSVRDYIAVDNRGRPLAPPFKDYGEAKRRADRAGGHVEFQMGERTVAAKRAPTVWTRQNTKLETWFERDNSLVDLQTLDGQTIIEWRDEAVAEAVEDGFLDPRDYHGSAVEYANHVGAQAPRGGRRAGEVEASRTSRGRFAGKPVPAPNPGMNPFGPQAQIRLESQWQLGDAGAVYEFNIKLRRVQSSASDVEWEQDVGTALEEFEYELQKKYPWIGRVYTTGRSGGWLAVEDPNGKMTKATLQSMSQMVEAAKRQFVKDMEQAYPREAHQSREMRAAPSADEVAEMIAIMEKHGYSAEDARKLSAEGMGPMELEHILRTTKPGGMGSLEYTHRIHKTASRTHSPAPHVRTPSRPKPRVAASRRRTPAKRRR
jgi:hypothetical protein